MRFLPVVSGALTLALCFHLGRRWIAAEAGALAVVLLAFWRWTPAGGEGQGSGVLLLDVARIARYDILTAPLGLAALGLFLLGDQTGGRVYLLAFLNSHQSSAPDSFTDALTFLAPRYVVIDEVIWHNPTETDLPGSTARNETFWTYLRQHSARLVETLPDNNGYLVRIYQLNQTGVVY